jgi:hypothetical protein
MLAIYVLTVSCCVWVRNGVEILKGSCSTIRYKTITFDVHVTVHRDKFLIIKPTRCTNFSNLFWNETLHVSDSSSVHHQEFFTVRTTMVYVIQVYSKKKTPDDGQRNCPKHVVSFDSILILLASCQQTCMTYTIAVRTVKNSR